jgi:hypothetical protein
MVVAAAFGVKHMDSFNYRFIVLDTQIIRLEKKLMRGEWMPPPLPSLCAVNRKREENDHCLLSYIELYRANETMILQTIERDRQTC